MFFIISRIFYTIRIIIQGYGEMLHGLKLNYYDTDYLIYNFPYILNHEFYDFIPKLVVVQNFVSKNKRIFLVWISTQTELKLRTI